MSLLYSAALYAVALRTSLPVLRIAAFTFASALPWYQAKGTEAWSRAHIPLLYAVAILARLLITGEAVQQVSPYRTVPLTVGLAAGWCLWAWQISGQGLTVFVQARDLANIGMFAALLVPVMLAWRFRMDTIGYRHAWITLAWLGDYALVSWLHRWGGAFPPNAWWVVDTTAHLGYIACCAGWISVSCCALVSQESRECHSGCHRSA